jgi:hypothetical protein
VQTALAEPGEYRRTHLLALIESLRGTATASGPMEETKLEHSLDVAVAHDVIIDAWWTSL